MVDMSLKGTSVETDIDDISNCYGTQVSMFCFVMAHLLKS